MSHHADPPAPDTVALICSARSCREVATWQLLWNNPKLHTADRRKSWLACTEHRDQLAAFLRARNFLRAVEALTGQGGTR
ncbi:hypothetical protein BH18ACT9_BH18ACT9_09100 [soil metagenome]